MATIRERLIAAIEKKWVLGCVPGDVSDAILREFPWLSEDGERAVEACKACKAYARELDRVMGERARCDRYVQACVDAGRALIAAEPKPKWRVQPGAPNCTERLFDGKYRIVASFVQHSDCADYVARMNEEGK